MFEYATSGYGCYPAGPCDATDVNKDAHCRKLLIDQNNEESTYVCKKFDLSEVAPGGGGELKHTVEFNLDQNQVLWTWGTGNIEPLVLLCV